MQNEEYAVTTTPPTTEIEVPTHGQIAALKADVNKIDLQMASACHKVDERKVRVGEINARIAQLEAQKPHVVELIDPTLVDAMAGDPNAIPDSAALAQKLSEARSIEDGWKLQISVAQRAAQQVEQEAATLMEEVYILRNQRDLIWEQFVRSAHLYLLDRFRNDFVQLCQSTLYPLVALQRQTSDGSYNGNKIVRGMYLDEDSLIKICHPVSRGSPKKEQLLSFDLDGEILADALNGFLSNLPSSPEERGD